ncbi:MAG: 3-hydroxyacyl-CoA dehydrogenase [Chloroflexota bacterium]
MQPDKKTIGIVGAGTMGAGIALTALYKGYDVVLQDSFPQSLENATVYLEKFLKKKGLEDHIKKINITDDLSEMAAADIVVEAIIEDLEIKRTLFQELEKICKDTVILATNTSTLAVTAIAAVVERPERVAGMHFFNPAPILPLVEIVSGVETSPDVILALHELAEALGKTPVVTNDTPGFIVNRVARPFYGEALRLLGEGVADHQTIDRIIETGAGFRMGPFRLMDLIGIDINATAMKSMYEQTFGEPRYRPHWIQMQKMQAGALGRKTGKGFYDYEDIQEGGGPEEEKSSATPGDIILSEGSWLPGGQVLFESSGFQVQKYLQNSVKPQICLIAAGRDEGLEQLVDMYDNTLPADIPILVQSVDVTLSEILTWVKSPHRICGIDGLFFAEGGLVTLAEHSDLDDAQKKQVEVVFQMLGKTAIWVQDSPALVLPRVILMIANESAFANLEGVADEETIDLAMRLGVNYPKGPIAWANEIGFTKVVQVLDHLHDEYGEERYRACIQLRRWARQEKR